MIILVLHIISSCLGIVGTYLHGLFRVRRGLFIERIGLIGVTFTGLILSFTDTDQLLSSSRLLAGITLVPILIVAHILLIRDPRENIASIGRYTAVFTWTWIFAVAISGTTFSYAAYLAVYAATGISTVWFLSRRYRR
ncbi:MAG: hypothetical protein KGI59_01695 [Patescibacteria group bacterium]|nr:hypothetical protein [Patescibacteria group bacterium]MDE2172548.1 hypothetical protein [Patescibacteria group bacterium]